ncbi:MAG: class I SAM-dependent methyltransferase [Alphaproteobacteria bacterium]
MIKQKIKAILPTKIKRIMRSIRISLFGMEWEYNNKSNSEVFDKIYRDGVWGKTSNGESTSGSGSHSREIITPYIDVVETLLDDVKPRVIVDIGCGDFNVGSHFLTYTQHYIACDVSSVILERNKKQYQSFGNVEFLLLDLASDELPKGDLAFVRQVLQHISNDHIQSFVDKIHCDQPFKFLIVTEHLPAKKSFKANTNKPAGSNIRAAINSGVVLHKPPFSLKSKKRSILLEVPKDIGDINAVIRSTLYEF